MKFLLVLLLAVGCGDVQGTPFGGEPLGSGGAAGSVVSSSGGSAGAPTVLAGSGGALAAPGGSAVAATGGAGGTPYAATGGAGGTAPVATGGSAIYIESLPVCPDYVTEFGSPITSSRVCGTSADGHLLYGCVGVVRQGYPTDSTPCQFTDPNDEYNGSHVFGCVDMQSCSPLG